MTKTYLFDSFLTVSKSKKLSKTGSRETNCSIIASTAGWYLVQLEKTRTRDTKQSLVFKRDPRKVSTLTTRIGQAHFSGHELVPNEYAKEARGLSMLISKQLLSMRFTRESAYSHVLAF